MMKSCVTISLVEEARGGPFVLWDDLDRSIEFAAGLGFDAIEIFAPDPAALDADDLGRRLEQSGMRLAAMGTGAGWVKRGLQLADPDPHRRREARDFVNRVVDAAGLFGAVAIIGSMQGRSGGGVDAETARAFLVEALEEGGETAKKHHVPLIFEPLNRYETNQCCTVADGVRLIESLRGGNVRLLLDLFHMNIEETDLPAAIRQAGPHVGHVHFVDSNRQAAGRGHLAFGPIVAALREIGYQGYLSAEAFPIPDPDEAARQTMRAFRYWAATA